MTESEAVFDGLYGEASRVLVGHRDVVEGMTIALLADGHVLLEGVPGVAKTTIANLFARTLGLEFTRIQMTPDLLPADIVGTSVYRQETGEFDIRRGPVFSNIVLADEINRATAQTQSAMLEAMQERHVTIEGETLPLPDPFILIATQNPLDTQGTFELPVAQRDRFQLKLDVEVPGADTGMEILDRFDESPTLDVTDVERAVSMDSLQRAKEETRNVYVDPKVKRFIQTIIDETWADDRLEYGASPRASIQLLNTIKAYATLQGREYVIPGDVVKFGTPVLGHRLSPSPDARLEGLEARDVIALLLEELDPPEVTPDATGSGASD